MEASCFPEQYVAAARNTWDHLTLSFPGVSLETSREHLPSAARSTTANKHHAPAASFAMIWLLLSHSSEWRKHFRFTNKWPCYESQVKMDFMKLDSICFCFQWYNYLRHVYCCAVKGSGIDVDVAGQISYLLLTNGRYLCCKDKLTKN